MEATLQYCSGVFKIFDISHIFQFASLMVIPNALGVLPITSLIICFIILLKIETTNYFANKCTGKRPDRNEPKGVFHSFFIHPTDCYWAPTIPESWPVLSTAISRNELLDNFFFFLLYFLKVLLWRNVPHGPVAKTLHSQPGHVAQVWSLVRELDPTCHN